jgi:hypothetical protein
VSFRGAVLWVCALQHNEGEHMYISIGAAILILILLIIFVF